MTRIAVSLENVDCPPAPLGLLRPPDREELMFSCELSRSSPAPRRSATAAPSGSEEAVTPVSSSHCDFCRAGTSGSLPINSAPLAHNDTGINADSRTETLLLLPPAWGKGRSFLLHVFPVAAQSLAHAAGQMRGSEGSEPQWTPQTSEAAEETSLGTIK